MHVSCFFINTKQGSTADDQALVDKNTNLARAEADYFDQAIKPRLVNNLLTLDQLEMIVLGGRESIETAFNTDPVASYLFGPPQGNDLYLSFSRHSFSKKTKAAGLMAARVGQVATAPIYEAVAAVINKNSLGGLAAHLKSTISPEANRKVFTTLGFAVKKRTVLHIFSLPPGGAGGTKCASGPVKGSVLGAMLHALFED